MIGPLNYQQPEIVEQIEQDIKLLASMGQGVFLDTPVNELEQFYGPKHIGFIDAACRRFGHFILIRRTNEESIKYINRVGFEPKPMECKPKTAKSDCTRMINGKKRTLTCGGLVVKPQKVGQAAYKGNAYAFAKAVQVWKNNFGDVPSGFKINEDETSPFYGCVMRCEKNQTTGNYIYGDYDLYGLVDFNNRELGAKQGNKNIHGPAWKVISTFLNNHFEVRMIQHGSQEYFAPPDVDEEVDMFTPYSFRYVRHIKIKGASALERLYEILFYNRQLIKNKIYYV